MLTAEDCGWQLRKLLCGYCSDIGETPPDEDGFARLAAAVKTGSITFFGAFRGARMVGMCSVARCFSTFACGDTGVFEDFYVEPVFRKQGAARRLADAALSWSREQGMASVTVCCAPCDEPMYRALGFTAPLGGMLAALTGA